MKRAWFALCVVLLAQVPAPSAAPAELLEQWRDALALDLPQEVLAANREALAQESRLDPVSGLGPVATGCARHFARDGRAVALIARAALLAESDGLLAARSILDCATPSAESTAYVELERVHLAVEADDLARALSLVLAAPDASEPRWPTLPQAWFEAGRALFRRGEIVRAAPFLRRFVELAPNDREAAAALHMLAREALERGDGATARACVERAEQVARWHALWRARTIQVREKPNEPLPRLGLGQLWLQVGDRERAKRVLTDLVTLAPTFAPGWFHLGEAERLFADWKLASAHYSKTLELDPDHLLARNNRATIALKEERLADARADFERIADGPHANEPLALGAHLQLVHLLDRLGESADATRRYVRYVELGGKERRLP